jgi:hypothetical protein
VLGEIVLPKEEQIHVRVKLKMVIAVNMILNRNA